METWQRIYKRGRWMRDIGTEIMSLVLGTIPLSFLQCLYQIVRVHFFGVLAELIRWEYHLLFYLWFEGELLIRRAPWIIIQSINLPVIATERYVVES